MKRALWVLALSTAVLGGTTIYLVANRPSSPALDESRSGGKILYYRDPMNPANTSPVPRKAPDGMDYVPVYGGAGEGERGEAGGVVVIDPVTVQNIGVRMERVEKRTLTHVVRTVGRVEYDETRLYDVTTKIGGYVDKLYVDFTGQAVRRDEPLLEIYSPEVVSAQQEYLVALRAAAAAESADPGSRLDDAVELRENARRRLQLWDIPAHEIRELEERGAPRRTVMLHAPVDGIVVEKMILEGAAVEPGMHLFKIADLSRVWVQADVYEYELPWVRVGEPAEVELTYLPGRIFRGRVAYIDPYLSAVTRTVRVRVELANPAEGLVLRPDMFATVRLQSAPRQDVLAVRDQAVIRSGERTLVVEALGGGRFTSRDVELGMSAGDWVEVMSGIEEGAEIVTSSQFLIDSESNLRAAVSAFLPVESAADTTEVARPAVPEVQGRHAGHGGSH